MKKTVLLSICLLSGLVAFSPDSGSSLAVSGAVKKKPKPKSGKVKPTKRSRTAVQAVVRYVSAPARKKAATKRGDRVGGKTSECGWSIDGKIVYPTSVFAEGLQKVDEANTLLTRLLHRKCREQGPDELREEIDTLKVQLKETKQELKEAKKMLFQYQDANNHNFQNFDERLKQLEGIFRTMMPVVVQNTQQPQFPPTSAYNQGYQPAQWQGQLPGTRVVQVSMHQTAGEGIVNNQLTSNLELLRRSARQGQ